MTDPDFIFLRQIILECDNDIDNPTRIYTGNTNRVFDKKPKSGKDLK